MGLFGKSEEDLKWDAFYTRWKGYEWESMTLEQRYNYIIEQYRISKISPVLAPHAIFDLFKLIEILKTRIDALEKK